MARVATAVKVPKSITLPEAKISGYAMSSLLKSILFDEIIKPHFEEVMRQYGFAEADIQPEEWYSLQMYHDLMKVLREKSQDTLVLVSIGIKAIETAILPPEIDSIPTGMQMLMDTHHLNLRNIPEHDRYRDLVIEDRRITVVEQTSFAHDIMYGYIYGLANRFRPEGTSPVIKRTYLDEADPDADGALYEVTW